LPIVGCAGSDLEGEVPDHSTFSKNRHGFRDCDLLRERFENDSVALHR